MSRGDAPPLLPAVIECLPQVGGQIGPGEDPVVEFDGGEQLALLVERFGVVDLGSAVFGLEQQRAFQRFGGFGYETAVEPGGADQGEVFGGFEAARQQAVKFAGDLQPLKLGTGFLACEVRAEVRALLGHRRQGQNERQNHRRGG